MNSRAGLAAALLLAVVLEPGSALAHSAPFGITGYPVLVLHPFIVLDHALCLLAAGLFSGQQEALGPWRGLAGVIFGVVAGFACLVLFPAFPGDVFLPLFVALVTGLLVALAPALNRWAALPVVFAAGFAVGLNTYPEDGLLFVLAMTLGGLIIGAGLLLVLVAWPVERLARAWQRIGVRILGSWVAASVSLVLALIAGS